MRTKQATNEIYQFIPPPSFKFIKCDNIIMISLKYTYKNQGKAVPYNLSFFSLLFFRGVEIRRRKREQRQKNTQQQLERMRTKQAANEIYHLISSPPPPRLKMYKMR